MEELTYRVRTVALWVIAMIAFFAYRTIAVSAGATEVSVLSDSELASMLAVMMLFALLTLVLGPRLSRPANLVAGVIFVVASVAMFADGITGYPSAAFNLMTGAMLVATAAVVWFAARRPRPQRQETKAPGLAPG